MDSHKLYLRLLSYVRPYWRAFAVSLFTMALLAASEPILPALMKPMLDGSFVEKDPFIIRWIPFAIVGLFAVRGVASFISAYSLAYVGNRLIADLRREMFEKLIHQPTVFFDDVKKGRIIATIAYNVTQVTDSATRVLTALVRDILAIVGLLGWMFYLNWKLSLVTLLLVPVAGLIFRAVSHRLRQTSRDIQRNMGDITHVLEEAIGGQKVMKIFGGRDYERFRFGQSITAARHYAMKQTVASQAYSPVLELMAAVALAIIVYIATLQASSDETTVGGFVSFMVAMLMLSAPMKRLSGMNAILQRGLAAAEDIFALLDRSSEEDKGRLTLSRAKGEIVFEQVGLAYAGKHAAALSDINLHIRPGETIALVGASGSGKTSLANLIPRFYNPTQGRILVDGMDSQEIRLADLRANIALVSQEVTLFNDSVAANIAYGRIGEVGEAEILQAAEAAHAMEFIRDLPQGLETPVGENGVKLSGGQRQRLAIARAILKDAPILILDEATSALDTASEQHVQAALENLMRNRTTLIIAHRLSTIERADRILVLDKGHIVEAGKHAELLARQGHYTRLHAMQFRQPPSTI